MRTAIVTLKDANGLVMTGRLGNRFYGVFAKPKWSGSSEMLNELDDQLKEMTSISRFIPDLMSYSREKKLAIEVRYTGCYEGADDLILDGFDFDNQNIPET